MPQMPPNPDQEVHMILPRRLIVRLLEWEEFINRASVNLDIEVSPADLALDAELKQVLRAVLALSA